MRIAIPFLAVAAVLPALMLPTLFKPTPAVSPLQARHFTLCSQSPVPNCVVDGDTIHWSGQIIRLADIDTPEIGGFKCQSELALGTRATNRLRVLLNAAPVALVLAGNRDADRYGRKLRLVVDGTRSLGAMLVAEGLARPWDGTRHGWCA